MFAKLMIDSTEVWTRQYGIDAFRFDLMSFHPKDLMVRLRDNLRRFNPDVYVYGEGWTSVRSPTTRGSCRRRN